MGGVGVHILQRGQFRCQDNVPRFSRIDVEIDPDRLQDLDLVLQSLSLFLDLLHLGQLVGWRFKCRQFEHNNVSNHRFFSF